MKKTYLIILGLIILGIVSSVIYYSSVRSGTGTEVGLEGACKIKEMVYYYLDACPWCQKIKKEETISKIEELGIEVEEINAEIGPIKHTFRSVPTFAVAGEIYSGYKTFKQLKKLLDCK